MTISLLPPEDHYGNVEYKSTLTHEKLTYHRMQRLRTQMLWRMNEGADLTKYFRAIYVLGVYDNGTIAKCDREQINGTIDVIEHIANSCKACIYRMIYVDLGIGRIAVLFIRKDYNKRFFPLYNHDIIGIKESEDDDDKFEQDLDSIIE